MVVFFALQVVEIFDQFYGQIIIASYGLVALHFWTQRGLRMTSGFLAECDFYLRLLRKFMGVEAGLTEEAQKRVHERRRVSLQEIASLWSLVLDLFVLCLFVFQATGVSPPMINSKCFFVTVSVGSTVMRRMGDPEVDLTPERLNRDMTIMSLLVFGATLGMPRELMPACYMARMLCFTFTNSQISNKVNILLAPFYVISHWLNEPNAPVERLLFSMIGEMVAVALMILVVTNLDTKERHAAVATLELEAKGKEVQEAEQEGGAAQRLLSVTCDAFVRLTHDLKIKTPSRSLLDMLMCHFGSNNANTLDGMLFSRYIAPQDQQRFTDFIAESSQANAPARSLHVDMKDSSGVTFSAELFHVTVPSLTSEHEHLIGISNDSSGDRVERLEQTEQDLTKEPNPLPSMNGDMRHILGHRFRHPHLEQVEQASSRSRLSLSSRSSSNSSGRQLDLKKLKSLEKVNVIIDVGSFEDDYMIRSLSLTFNIPENCDIKLLPNLMEWLKPNHRKKVSDWIQTHANAQYAGRPCKEPSLRGTKMTSLFPSTNTLLVGELKFAGISDVFPEGRVRSPKVLSPKSVSSVSSGGEMYMNLELRQLYAH